KELVSHYLKMNNILSNALKNTEATEQTKFYKLSETDFKTKFESHLKTTGCDTNAGDSNFTPNVCLADGSQFAYGTFDESCTDNICDTLTIDTNGKKGPNTAGKDRFTMNLTPNGVKALGESDSCKNGLDCGAYILAHHKLWTGESSTPIPTGCLDANCNNCDDGYYNYSSGCTNDKNILKTEQVNNFNNLVSNEDLSSWGIRGTKVPEEKRANELNYLNNYISKYFDCDMDSIRYVDNVLVVDLKNGGSLELNNTSGTFDLIYRNPVTQEIIDGGFYKVIESNGTVHTTY
ncbi:hypothetical protein IJ732_05775, partial [bacterium]|nr:hypothetical protein [bacterium]